MNYGSVGSLAPKVAVLLTDGINMPVVCVTINSQQCSLHLPRAIGQAELAATNTPFTRGSIHEAHSEQP